MSLIERRRSITYQIGKELQILLVMSFGITPVFEIGRCLSVTSLLSSRTFNLPI
jgi:hypothetical protein